MGGGGTCSQEEIAAVKVVEKDSPAPNPARAAEKKGRNIDFFMEELKKAQEARERRAEGREYHRDRVRPSAEFLTPVARTEETLWMGV